LGPTSGLNVDGQHHHIWDTVVPTFIHYNLPLRLLPSMNSCGLLRMRTYTPAARFHIESLP
ncbi:Na+/H+ antiporter NhaC family protein, partial [Pseudomonas fulva]|uniref:Na+/H+ antiporter NhaC family protein n=1 Tax=Pseudomonas fulva TaxID=47880 RepID=UPI003D058A7D